LVYIRLKSNEIGLAMCLLKVIGVTLITRQRSNGEKNGQPRHWCHANEYVCRGIP